MTQVDFPIGDFLIRVKNAALAGHRTLSVISTRMIKNTATALKEMGYLDEVTLEGKTLTTKITYKSKKPLLTNITLVSKPGRRVYLGYDDLVAKKSPSMYIVSTPKGVMSQRNAIKQHLGGEVIAEVL